MILLSSEMGDSLRTVDIISNNMSVCKTGQYFVNNCIYITYDIFQSFHFLTSMISSGMGNHFRTPGSVYQTKQCLMNNNSIFIKLM